MRNKKKGKVSKAVKAYVRKELRDETPIKQAQFNMTGAAVGTTGLTVYDWCIPTIGNILDRGDAFNQRQGDVIKVHELTARVSLNCASTGAFRGRYIVLYDKVPNGVITDMRDLLYSNTTLYAVHSAYNIDQENRYRILGEGFFDLTSNYLQAAAGGDSHLIRFHKKFKTPLKVAYSYLATAGTIADIELGRICLVLISDNTALTVLTGILELQFSDA